MSNINSINELAAIFSTLETVRTVEIVSRLDTLFRNEKLEAKNRAAASKHLQMIQLTLSRNRVKE